MRWLSKSLHCLWYIWAMGSEFEWVMSLHYLCIMSSNCMWVMSQDCELVLSSDCMLIIHSLTGLDKQNFERKILNIFLPISFKICFGCSKEPSH